MGFVIDYSPYPCVGRSSVPILVARSLSSLLPHNTTSPDHPSSGCCPVRNTVTDNKGTKGPQRPFVRVGEAAVCFSVCPALHLGERGRGIVLGPSVSAASAWLTTPRRKGCIVSLPIDSKQLARHTPPAEDQLQHGWRHGIPKLVEHWDLEHQLVQGEES